MLLSGSDSVALSDCLLAQQLVELSASLLGFLIVLLDLALLTVLFEQSQEVNYLVVCRDIDDAIFGRRLADEVLSVEVVRIILGELIFHLLHHFYEVFETDALIVVDLTARVVRLLVAVLILLGVTNTRSSDLDEQHLGLDRVPVKRLHDRLEV